MDISHIICLLDVIHEEIHDGKCPKADATKSQHNQGLFRKSLFWGNLEVLFL